MTVLIFFVFCFCLSVSYGTQTSCSDLSLLYNNLDCCKNPDATCTTDELRISGNAFINGTLDVRGQLTLRDHVKAEGEMKGNGQKPILKWSDATNTWGPAPFKLEDILAAAVDIPGFGSQAASTNDDVCLVLNNDAHVTSCASQNDTNSSGRRLGENENQVETVINELGNFIFSIAATAKPGAQASLLKPKHVADARNPLVASSPRLIQQTVQMTGRRLQDGGGQGNTKVNVYVPDPTCLGYHYGFNNCARHKTSLALGWVNEDNLPHSVTVGTDNTINDDVVQSPYPDSNNGILHYFNTTLEKGGVETKKWGEVSMNVKHTYFHGISVLSYEINIGDEHRDILIPLKTEEGAWIESDQHVVAGYWTYNNNAMLMPLLQYKNSKVTMYTTRHGRPTIHTTPMEINVQLECPDDCIGEDNYNQTAPWTSGIHHIPASSSAERILRTMSIGPLKPDTLNTMWNDDETMSHHSGGLDCPQYVQWQTNHRPCCHYVPNDASETVKQLCPNMCDGVPTCNVVNLNPIQNIVGSDIYLNDDLTDVCVTCKWDNITTECYNHVRVAYKVGRSKLRRKDKVDVSLVWRDGDQTRTDAIMEAYRLECTSLTSIGHATSMGQANRVKGSFSVAMGSFNEIESSRGVAIGFGNKAGGGTAMGALNVASETGTVAMGMSNKASSEGAVVMGKDNVASGKESVATGLSNEAIADYSVSMGRNNEAVGTGSVAVGGYNKATADYSVAMGGGEDNSDGNVADGTGAVAMGINNKAGKHSVAMGENNEAGYNNGDDGSGGNVAMGRQNIARGGYTTVFGQMNQVTQQFSVAMGKQNINKANSAFTVGVGNKIDSDAQYGVAMGKDNRVSARGSVAIGRDNGMVIHPELGRKGSKLRNDPTFKISPGIRQWAVQHPPTTSPNRQCGAAHTFPEQIDGDLIVGDLDVWGVQVWVNSAEYYTGNGHFAQELEWAMVPGDGNWGEAHPGVDCRTVWLNEFGEYDHDSPHPLHETPPRLASVKQFMSMGEYHEYYLELGSGTSLKVHFPSLIYPESKDAPTWLGRCVDEQRALCLMSDDVGNGNPNGCACTGTFTEGEGCTAYGACANKGSKGTNVIPQGEMVTLIGVGNRAGGTFGASIGVGNVANAAGSMSLGVNNQVSVNAPRGSMALGIAALVPDSTGEAVTSITGLNVTASPSRLRRLGIAEKRRPKVVVGGDVEMMTVNMETRTASSDRRVKQNEVSLEGALAKVRQLQVKTYDYTDNFVQHTRRTRTSNVGLIAQEVLEVIPRAVTTLGRKGLYRFDEGRGKHILLEELDDFLQLDKDVLLMHALAAIKELSQEHDRLVKRVEMVESVMKGGGTG